jgi:hypothetical protein
MSPDSNCLLTWCIWPPGQFGKVWGHALSQLEDATGMEGVETGSATWRWHTVTVRVEPWGR